MHKRIVTFELVGDDTYLTLETIKSLDPKTVVALGECVYDEIENDNQPIADAE